MPVPCCLAFLASWIVSNSVLMAAIRFPTATEATAWVAVMTIIGSGFLVLFREAMKAIGKAQIEREQERNDAMIAMQLKRDASLKDTVTEQNQKLQEQIAELQVDLKEARDRADQESISLRGMRTDFHTANALNLELTRQIVGLTAQLDRMSRELEAARRDRNAFARDVAVAKRFLSATKGGQVNNVESEISPAHGEAKT